MTCPVATICARALGLVPLLALMLICIPPSAMAQNHADERRLALVIGNAAYKSAPLLNPVNDARAMARVLEATGFEVKRGENLGRQALFETLRDFGNALDEKTVAVVFYAGHGVQVRDRNYLIPVDADIQVEEDIPYVGMDAQFILDRMSRAQSRLNVLILDACRDNPFGRNTRTLARGLAQMDAPIGTLIAYATAPGKLAADGVGPNSIYTKHLVQQLLTPGIPVEVMFRRVREAVVRETREMQVPWENSSIRGEFHFAAAPAVAPREAAPAIADVGASLEVAFWESIRSSDRPAEFQAYLDQYPNGRFQALARTRMATLAAAAVPAPPAQTAAITSTPAPRVETATAPPGFPKVGDRWTYSLINMSRTPHLRGRNVMLQIIEVSPKRITDRTSILGPGAPANVALDGEEIDHTSDPIAVWRFGFPDVAPYAQAFGRLGVGDRIPRMAGSARDGNSRFTIDTGEAVALERIAVPAGTFETTRVRFTGAWTWNWSPGSLRPFTVTAWYSPQLRRTVKVLYEGPASVVALELDSFELK